MLKSIVKKHIAKRTLALAAVLCLWHGAVAQNVVTVAAGNVNDLINKVNAAQSGTIINVPAGTYNLPASNPPACYYDCIILTLKSGVSLIGAGKSQTIIQGNGSAIRAISVTGGTDTTRIKNIGFNINSTADNSGSIISASGNTVKLVMENCDIIGKIPKSGGAIYLANGAYARIVNSDIHGCTAQEGGAFYVQNATLDLTGCHIYDNASSGSGGVFFVSGGHLNIKGGNIHDNRSTNHGTGGVGYIAVGSTVTVENASFVGNESQHGGSSFGLDGNGNTLTLSSCTIAGNNTAQTWAPGGIVASGSDQVTITNSIITGNTGGQPGTGDVGGGGSVDIIGSIVDDQYIVNGDTSYTFTEPPVITPGDSGQVNITLPGTVTTPDGDSVPITDVPNIPIDVDSSGNTVPTIGSGGGDNKPPELTLTLADSLVCVGQQATFTLRVKHLNGEVDYVLYKVVGGVKTQVSTTRSNSGSVSFNLTPQSATVEKYVGEARKDDKLATSKEKLLIVIPLATSGKIGHSKNVEN